MFFFMHDAYLFSFSTIRAQLMLTCAENGAVCMRRVSADGNDSASAMPASRGSEGGATEMVSEWSAKASPRGVLKCVHVDSEERKVAVGG